jgi:hypothetical protein
MKKAGEGRYCNWFRNEFIGAGAAIGLLNPVALGRMEFFALQQSVAGATTGLGRVTSATDFEIQ